jgi:hypothetical protein
MTKNVTVKIHSGYIFTNTNRTESNEQHTVVSTCVETLVHFKNFALLYSTVS